MEPVISKRGAAESGYEPEERMSDTKHINRLPSRRLRFMAVVVLGGLVLAVCGWWVTRPTRAELEQGVFDAFARKDFARAEALLLQIEPRDADVLRLLPEVCLQTGRTHEAIQWLEQGAELSKSPSDGFLATGARAFELGLSLEAERLCRRSLELEPKSLKTYSQLARLCLAWGRGTELRHVIAEADSAGVALEGDPLLLWLWVIGDRVHWLEEDSRQWLELAHREQPDEPFVAAALVHSWLAEKRVDRAGEIVDAFPRTSSLGLPSWPMALAATAVAFETKDFGEANSLLGPFTDGGEEQAATWFWRGKLWSRFDEKRAAWLAFTRASELDPFFVAALHERGRLLVPAIDPQAERALEITTRTDELVRRCMQLAQSTRPHWDDLQAVAVLGAELGATRWTQLVCRLAEQQDASIRWPEKVAAIRNLSTGKLSVGKPPPISDELTLDLLSGKGRSFAARKTTQKKRPLAERKTTQTTDETPRLAFAETTRELRLHFVYEFGHSPQRWLMETLGGGVAVLDFDADGWPDLFFAQGGSLDANGTNEAGFGKLLRNVQGESLLDVTDSSQAIVRRYSHGCAVGDNNDDGFADLLVCQYCGLTLLLNQGDGTWQEQTESAGLANDRWNTSASFVDLDRDGDLDLYVARYCRAPLTPDLRVCRTGERAEPCRPNAYPAEPDAVFENLGDGRFADRSIDWGIASQTGYGLGVIAADFDLDGVPEVFVGNDSTHNFLWHMPNGRRGVMGFADRSLVAGVAVDGSGRAEASMGIACGDIDGDERLDLFVTTFFDETSTLFHSVGGTQFDDETQHRGLSNAGQRLMGWGAQFFDADNDGWLDLALVNGHLHDRPQRPQFYRNQRGHFADESASAGSYFTAPKLGRSLATWDYNCDGRVDLVVSHQREPASVLRNDSRAGRSLVLRLIGSRSPRDATGAIVRARVGDQWIMRLVSTQGGYLSANSADVVIGLGAADAVDELVVNWPSGSSQRFTELAAGSRFLIREGATRVVPQ